MVAAQVEILSRANSPRDLSIEARIVSMLRGTYSGETLRIEPSVITSCDGIPAAGTRGIVIGRVVPSADGVLVIDPVRGPSGIERKLQIEPRSGELQAIIKEAWDKR